MRFQSFFWRNRLREWREAELLDAALVLNQLATDLIEKAASDIQSLTKSQLVTQQATFLARHVGPMVRTSAEPIVAELVDRANSRLSELASHQAIWAEQPGAEPTDEGFGGWQDVTLAAAPIAGGVAAAAALPALAVTTTASMFGLVTVTSISWPVVIGGGAIAGGLLATGAWNASQLLDRLRQRLRRKARDLIVSLLIHGNEKAPSVLQQFCAMLDQTVQQAKRT